jgi:integrase
MSAYQRPTWLPAWISITNDGRISYYEGGAKGIGDRKQERCRTTDRAERRARELTARYDRAAGLAVEPGATWTDLCQEWVDAHDGNIAEGTLRRRITSINCYILPAIGKLELGATDVAAYTAVSDQAVASGNGRSTYDSAIQTLTTIAAWGRARKRLPENTFGAADTQKDTRRQARQMIVVAIGGVETDELDGIEADIALDMVPTWEQVVQLSEAVADRIGGQTKSRAIGEHYGRAVLIAAGSGLRMCELLGLRSEDIDLESGLINVNHQLDRYREWAPDGPMPMAPVKHGNNHIASAFAIIRPTLEAALEDADGGPLFPAPHGQHWWADAWGRCLEAVRAEIGWGWKPHWLRHHYGSYAINPREVGGYGMAPVEVQRSMGHKHLETTLRTYTQALRAHTGWIE